MKSALSQLELIESCLESGMRGVSVSLEIDSLVNDALIRLQKYKPEFFDLECLDEDTARYLNRVGRKGLMHKQVTGLV